VHKAMLESVTKISHEFKLILQLLQYRLLSVFIEGNLSHVIIKIKPGRVHWCNRKLPILSLNIQHTI